MSEGNVVKDFLKNPALESLKKTPSLIDQIGEFLGRMWSNENLGEHQLRRVHERLLELYYKSQKLRVGRDSADLDKSLEVELARLKYFMVYQRARIDRDKGRFYFEPFIKLVGTVRSYDDIEMLFYLSESVIAYYNYHKGVNIVGRR